MYAPLTQEYGLAYFCFSYLLGGDVRPFPMPALHQVPALCERMGRLSFPVIAFIQIL